MLAVPTGVSLLCFPEWPWLGLRYHFSFNGARAIPTRSWRSVNITLIGTNSPSAQNQPISVPVPGRGSRHDLAKGIVLGLVLGAAVSRYVLRWPSRLGPPPRHRRAQPHRYEQQ